ncbi:cytochrome b/b6 domain-containing protein [Colwellia sp. 1_MG-2023]|uniref:cytochrome b/b6 domain-containing protein n=1 Tax=Colwellia sp. 1_MG-2023 TaxID=3062649 RepID=UPI0026E14ACF|nr:cytochrome b/b6 domain-containing protein [Colwellia sp. 1_MG-2023]MDO6445225.1 cytochrome b/b6 domain-containing protein [Colwellia sp. 1_MG-2023]
MAKQQLIWDLPVRIFHWCFVGVLLALWYTSDQDNGLIEVHIKLGYTALGLTIFRILWGFVGTTHAKFINFIPRPKQIKSYIQQLRIGKVKNYIGHNPLGSLMVIFILFAVLVQATSGLFISDDIFSAGPYNSVLTSELEKILKTVHSNGFNIIATLSAIHILAVLYYLIVKKQNLIKPMFTGKKSLNNDDAKHAIKHSKLFIALIVAIAVVCFVYWLVVINAPVIEEYYY